jgi:ketosteroid isomerase-like protein
MTTKTSEENALLIAQFYAAFQSKDYKAMQAAYHPQATFKDPVFGPLQCNEVRAMWQMLTMASADLRISVEPIDASEHQGSCVWEARYTFSRTGKPVHNIVKTTFQFREGLIIAHEDNFDFWRWARQAFGVTGLLIGWTSVFHDKISSMALAGLKKFMNKPAP